MKRPQDKSCAGISAHLSDRSLDAVLAVKKVAVPVKPIRVLLADDHTIVRAGIRALLDDVAQVEVVGEVANGAQTLELIEKLRPDVVLLDLMMPGLIGFDVLKEATERFPEVRVILLTVHEQVEYAYQALHLGASGYLPKSAASAELPLAIEHVMGGGKYVSPALDQSAAMELGRSSEGILSTELTPRQKEVLARIAEGQSTKDIALALEISIKTVETHRAQLMERLNIHNVAGLVRYAVKAGVVLKDLPATIKKMGGGF